MPKTVTYAYLANSITQDFATGKADALPVLLKIADRAYKGNLVSERIADWVTDHTGADGYRDLVKMVHEVLSKHTIELED